MADECKTNTSTKMDTAEIERAARSILWQAKFYKWVEMPTEEEAREVRAVLEELVQYFINPRSYRNGKGNQQVLELPTANNVVAYNPGEGKRVNGYLANHVLRNTKSAAKKKYGKAESSEEIQRFKELRAQLAAHADTFKSCTVRNSGRRGKKVGEKYEQCVASEEGDIKTQIARALGLPSDKLTMYYNVHGEGFELDFVVAHNTTLVAIGEVKAGRGELGHAYEQLSRAIALIQDGAVLFTDKKRAAPLDLTTSALTGKTVEEVGFIVAPPAKASKYPPTVFESAEAKQLALFAVMQCCMGKPSDKDVARIIDLLRPKVHMLSTEVADRMGAHVLSV